MNRVTYDSYLEIAKRLNDNSLDEATALLQSLNKLLLLATRSVLHNEPCRVVSSHPRRSVRTKQRSK